MSRSIIIVCLLMFVVADISGGATSQKLRELAREHAHKNSKTPLQVPAPPRDYWPKPIEEIAREAEVVLQAKLSPMKSYISASADYIATDYSIRDAQVVVGRLPIVASRTPGAVVPLILTDWGGETMVDGVLIRAIETSREAIKSDTEYLLFLRPARPQHEGQYEIYYGAIFEVTEDKVRPLLHQADAVFKGTVNGSREDLIRRIETAVRVR
jgi:hypothetical protein